jgi:hypothetical protein
MKGQSDYQGRGVIRKSTLIGIAIIVFCAYSPSVLAQWTQPDGSGNVNSTNTGNVGVGTTTPTFKLDVFSSTAAAFRAARDNSATDSPFVSAGTIKLYNPNTTANNFTGISFETLDAAGNIKPSSYIKSVATARTTSGVSGDLAFAIDDGASVIELMRLTSGSRVGIGTSTPSFKLDLQGGSINASGGLCIAGDCKTAWSQVTGVSSQWTTSGSNIYYNTGNIGIGTNNPASKLFVGSGTPAVQTLPGLNVALGSASYISASNGTENVFMGADGSGYGILGTLSNHGVGIRTNNVERMRINTLGNVGIGTTTPSSAYKLDVQGGSINSSAGLCIAGDCKSAWSQVLQWTPSGTTINYGAGNVGIGVPSPTAKLDVNGTVNATALTVSGTPVVSSQWNTSGTAINYATGNVGVATPNPTEKLHVTGNVKVVGSIDVTGNINAKYQDMAEWVESSQELPAGTVVVLDPTKSNQVIASTQSYDSRVAGVISLRPGVVLGERGEGRVLVATTGRVRVKVDATTGPIQIGDLLVTSEKSGVAMKSVPVEIGGVRIHRPGTLIGKALEPLAERIGEILVLLSLQ